MSSTPESPAQKSEALDDLDFERADQGPGGQAAVGAWPAAAEAPAGAVASSCAMCQGALHNEYWASAGQTLCVSCAQRVRLHNQGKGGLGGFIKAAAYGAGAAVLGSAIYYLVSLSGFEFGLIAILVGFMVGHAVRTGSGGYGGVSFQVLAVLLTYMAIACNAVPSVLRALTEGAPPAAADYVIAIMFSLWAPFIDPVENIMGIIIIAIGLWEAWKVNRRVTVDLAGPYPLAKGTAPQPSAQAQL